MAIQDIQNYIEANGARFRLETLLDHLRQAGYPENEIQEALRLRNILVPPPLKAKSSARKVFIILGIIAAVIVGLILVGFLLTVSSLNNTRSKSRDARRIADIRQIQLALELYFDANSVYPKELRNLAETGSCYGTNCMPAVPYDPSSSAPYNYEQRGDCGYYLGAYLEDPSNSALRNDANPSNAVYDIEVEPTVTTGPCAPPRNAPPSDSFGSQMPKITVFSPAKGDKLQRGVTQKIKWNTPLFVPYVKISVSPQVKPCSASGGPCPIIEYASYIIASKTENDGVFDWIIGKDRDAKYFSDGEYFVMITGLNTNGGIMAEGASDRFSIFQAK